MRLSRYFLPVMKEVPTDTEIVSHQLMVRAGMIKQAASGIYSWMPLGLRVLQKIQNIVTEEQEKAGHIPMLMPTIQPASLWQESGRYDDYGEEMLRIRDRHDRDLLYGPTNEELITDIFRQHIKSYKALPVTLFHIQWKFRDERRPRFGVMRGREFLMKDGYNFDLDFETAIHSYNRHMVSYLRTYNRMGLKAIPMRADTGPIGGKYSHEFLLLADTGESTVFYDDAILKMNFDDTKIDYDNAQECQKIVDSWTNHYARTDETHDQAEFDRLVPNHRQAQSKAIEVGQIFYFGTKYSDPMKATVVDEMGKHIPVHMGSHGIGVSRLVGAIIEASHDSRGIIWPMSVAPFKVGIVSTSSDDKAICQECERLYQECENAGLEPLYDDRNERPGAKFATMELIGIPIRITVGRGLKKGVVELTERTNGQTTEVSQSQILNKVIEIVNS